MFIRLYLRCSTNEQNPKRALEQVEAFIANYDQQIAATYIETASGASLDRPELHRLLSDAKISDVILVEQIDRLSRLSQDDWKQLKKMIEAKQLRIVSLDVPTTWQALSPTKDEDEITSVVLDSINNMLIELMIAMSRKDFEDRRRRQRQGIEAAQKIEGKYIGRRPNLDKHEKVFKYRQIGLTLKEVAEATGYSKSQVCKILAKQKNS